MIMMRIEGEHILIAVIVQMGVTWNILMTAMELINGVIQIITFTNKEPKKTFLSYRLIDQYSISYVNIFDAQTIYMTNWSFYSF